MSDEQGWSERLTRLNDLLATLYPEEDAARRVVTIARIPSSNIRFDKSATINWYNILEEAQKHNRVANIIAVARRQFPASPGWADIDADFWPVVKRFPAKIVGLALAVGGVAAAGLAYIYFGRPSSNLPASTITGYIQYQNSDAFVKGAVVLVPANNSQSNPTEEGGFFQLRDVPPGTRVLYVQVAGRLHDLIVADQPGYRYKVVPAVADAPPKLEAAQTEAVAQLVLKEPERFRLEGSARRESKLWNIASPIRVAFLDGAVELRKLVQTVATRWSDHANIRFEFGTDRNAADIRVSFAERMSYSYVGTDALGIEKQKPTIVLGTIADISTDREFSILHEFGHVLGLVHENQTPNAQQALDWNTIYAKAAQPPMLWDKAVVDLNLRPPRNLPEQYSAKPFDPGSVMMFPMPHDWFTPPLRVQTRRDLSQGDKEFIALLYPKK